MTKLLQNKPLIKFLGIALSILLVVALVPQISIAYGSKDDIADETALAETGENAATEGEEVAADGENAATSEEGTEPTEGDEAAEGEVVTIDGVEMVSHKVEVPGEEDENATEDVIAPQSSEDEGGDKIDNQEITEEKKVLVGNNNHVIKEKQVIKNFDADTNTNKTLVFDDGGSYTLTVDGTLKSDIKVSSGTTLTINGNGTIVGNGDKGQGSVIVVEKASKLVFSGPTVRGGTGTANPYTNAKGWGKMGGGILICRSTDSNPAWNTARSCLVFEKGTVTGNEAGTGGGILIDGTCGFTMLGGTVQGNTANTHEGGGIFFAGSSDGNLRGSKGIITGGSILENKTLTTADWGGGGIFVNSGATLRIESALITKNKAAGYGGGVAGCPHAKIGIGELAEGAAVFKNTADGEKHPSNKSLVFLTNPSTVAETSSERVGAGDFLAFGLLSGAQTHEGITAAGDKYAKGEFKGLANDFYCTLASYISGTNLGSHPGDIAWEGYVAGVPAGMPINEKSMDAGPVSIAVNEPYAASDASLGLTSTATSDQYEKSRKVTIKNNESATHGGGVGCNGTLEFGPLPKSEEVIAPYFLEFNKKLLNNVSNEKLALKAGEFKFKLFGKDKRVYTATNDEEGNIRFEGITGSQESTTVTFRLQEELTEDQIKAGYTSSIEGGVLVDVELKVTKDSPIVGGTTVTRYSAKPVSVKLRSTESNEITNTLNLKASESIPVKKIADGLYSGEFKFALKEVAPADGDITFDENKDVTLRDELSPLSLPVKEGTKEEVRTISVKNSVQAPTSGTTIPDATKDEHKDFNFTYEQPGTHWYVINEKKEVNIDGSHADAAPEISYDETAYLVKIDVEVFNGGRSLKTTKTVWRTVAGKNGFLKLVSDNEDGVVFTNVAIKYAGFNLSLNKQILTTLGKNLSLSDRTFGFALYEGENPSAEAIPIAQGTTDPNTGKLNLQIADSKYAKGAFGETAHEKEFTFTLKETPLEGEAANFMSTIEPATVKVILSAAGERTTKKDQNGQERSIYLVTPTVKTVTVNGTDVEVADNDITVTNRYAPNGTWKFQAEKFFSGLGEPSDCSFSLVEIERAPGEGEAISSIAVKKDLENKEFTPLVVNVTKDAIGADGAAIEFPAITYVVEGKGKNQRNDIGDHYYLITEDGDDAAKDTTAYVVKVTVAVDKNDPGKLVATETVRGYADDINSTLNPMPEGESPAFYNTDTYGMISAASYSVYAASGEPVDQVCYVDPKIIKNLEGRAIKSGEFAFKLIEVANYNDTEGTVISATTNDEFGMVDFDKANNVSGDLENPSCLAYTKPGTYYYRVIEDTSKGGMNDQSVLYSDQVITFTTVIEQDEATGRLVCTDMYYGYWDKAASKNVRYDEQYTDFDTQPSNIGDMSKLNPDWHPTITNKTRSMDLQVRKTSVSDRNEGLVGAAYGLYMVNENAQGDIWLAEATSEDGGWITYKNVSLSTNNLYYFKETAAPAGHTVSEFRSSYFYLVEDASSANGYALQYTDSKYLPEAAADEAAVQAEVSGTGQAKNAPAAQADTEAANEAAADTETQPGYSTDGNVLLTYDKDGGVYDEVTTLEVNKLDTRTHEWVEGAKLVILEKESGKEIASWTSGKAPQKLGKTLNVGTTYLLREVEAPDQYRLANDVEFVIDDYGNVSITKGTENGNAELSDNTIALYDTMLDAEETETIEREKSTTEKPNKDTLLAKTGDMLPILGIALVALAALIVVIVAVRRRRAGEDSASNE